MHAWRQHHPVSRRARTKDGGSRLERAAPALDDGVCLPHLGGSKKQPAARPLAWFDPWNHARQAPLIMPSVHAVVQRSSALKRHDGGRAPPGRDTAGHVVGRVGGSTSIHHHLAALLHMVQGGGRMHLQRQQKLFVRRQRQDEASLLGPGGVKDTHTHRPRMKENPARDLLAAPVGH
ncbi:hypothetical protein JDV02_003933 [Purpureocillium takamizusanense]|uniref:Uncharacterized protein n=1 Tax=Purpureocillium takamizusanense TaxID=2060973 RepID=A0A9Q8VAA4_9HYPO|nr:uncharacterized protein JDV02_003933 [Purpureocillium takamizusanense]UNI17601.1 hypothetical protein JDV02_003933 [Purpureocillium takamizusanense]